MGGNAFGPQAARLSIPSHAALEAFAAARLAPFFDPIAAPRAFKSKESHGDLDLIAGWDGVGWETMKGAARGVARATDGSEPGPRATVSTDVPAVLTTKDEGCEAEPKSSDADTKTCTDTKTSTSHAEKLPLPSSPLPQSPPPRSPPHSPPHSPPSPPLDTERHGTTPTAPPPVCATSPPAVLDAWCARIAAALDGTHWYRSGNEISVAVPADVLGRYMGAGVGGAETNTAVGSTPVETEGAAAAGVLGSAQSRSGGRTSRDLPSAPFYQVDILLVPTSGHAFTCFTYGYGTMVLILGHLLRAAAGTRSVYLHAHCVLLRTKPFFGIRATDVLLTSDPVELCRWLGLDYAAWIAAGNAGWDKEDMFAWFASCPAESRAARGLARLASYGRSAVVGARGHKGRMSVVDDMGVYLRDHGWSVPDDDDTPTTTESTPTPKPPAPTPTLDPDNPTPLTPAERGVLTFWDKLDAYADGVERARPIARELWDAQQRRAALREVERQIAAQEALVDQDVVEAEAEAARAQIEDMVLAHPKETKVEAA